MKRASIWLLSILLVLALLFALQRLPISGIPEGPHEPFVGYLQLKGWPWVSATTLVTVDAAGSLKWGEAQKSKGNDARNNLLFCILIAFLASGSVALFIVPNFPRYSILSLLMLVTAASIVALLYSLDFSVFGEFKILTGDSAIQVSNKKRPLYQNGLAFVTMSLAIHFLFELMGCIVSKVRGKGA